MSPVSRAASISAVDKRVASSSIERLGDEFDKVLIIDSENLWLWFWNEVLTILSDADGAGGGPEIGSTTVKKILR